MGHHKCALISSSLCLEHPHFVERSSSEWHVADLPPRAPCQKCKSLSITISPPKTLNPRHTVLICNSFIN